MATPTKSAQFTLDTQGQDFLQLVKSGGKVVAWIDDTGAPQGALAAGMGGAPGGTNTAIQFNDNGSFGGETTDGTTTGITWDKTAGAFTVVSAPGAFTSVSGGPTGSAGFQIDDTSNPTDVIFANTEMNGTLEFECSGLLKINSDNASVQIQDNAGNQMVEVGGTAQLGFYGATIIAKPTVTGAKAGNAALTSLLSKLVALGLITDGTS